VSHLLVNTSAEHDSKQVQARERELLSCISVLVADTVYLSMYLLSNTDFSLGQFISHAIKV
jgi:hypothetical protein